MIPLAAHALRLFQLASAFGGWRIGSPGAIAPGDRRTRPGRIAAAAAAAGVLLFAAGSPASALASARAAGAMPFPAASSTPAPAGAPDLVWLRDFAPRVREDIRYAGSDNFVGRPIDGYDAAKCLLTRPAAAALARAEQALAAEGFGLVVYDCYRPARAVRDFVRWARDLSDQRTKQDYYPEVPKEQLFERGYIAERSGHSRGSTVDLSLLRRVTGEDGSRFVPVDMGTPYDFFDPRSHTDAPAASASARRHRDRLRDAMTAAGFRNLPEEWWHYTLIDEPHPDLFFDVPVR